MELQATKVLLLICALTLYVQATEDFDLSHCIHSYGQLEKVAIRQVNKDSMTNGFYPPNRQAATAANVHYYIGDSQNFEYVYKFRWSTSPVLELIRPELLQDLSLYLYHGHTETIDVVIDPLCGVPNIHFAIQSNSFQVCSGEVNSSDPIQMLNKLTTHVRHQKLITWHALYLSDHTNQIHSFFLQIFEALIK